MPGSSPAIAKCGWVYRQTTFLKKWKRNWFVLHCDGYLRYFESDTCFRAEDAILISAEVTAIKTGTQVMGVRAPEHLSNNFLLSIETRSGKTCVICGDSLDDMRAWELALRQAQGIQYFHRPASVPPPYYSGDTFHRFTDDTSLTYVHPGNPYYCTNPPYYVNTPHGPTTVIIQREPRYYSSGTDMALGMMAGAALGTMMWTPLLWW